MKELPNPTFPLSQLGLRAALWPAKAPASSGLSVQWARHQDDVRLGIGRLAGSDRAVST